MILKLNNGREISVEGFYMGFTYGGLLEGSPNENINKSILEEVCYPSNWGRRKAIKLGTTEAELKSRLKPNYYSVWLNSDPIDPNSDGSQLVITWFGDRPDGKAIEEIIVTGIGVIDWLADAEDFFY